MRFVRRVGLLGSAAQITSNTPSNAKKDHETDSEQEPRGKVEKTLYEREPYNMKPLGGKRAELASIGKRFRLGLGS